MITQIFFDNDGILVDTEHLYFAASRQVLATRGIDLSEAAYDDLFLRRNRGFLHFADEHGWSPDELAALRMTRDACYADLLTSRPLVIDGVSDVLAALHGRVRMAIVTSSRRDHFDLVHDRAGLLQYFDFVLASGDYSESKPHPAPYLTALVRAGVPADQCLVVEDSARGLASALAAGLRTVIVPSRLTKGQPFDAAWRVLDTLRDLPEVIKTL